MRKRSNMLLWCAVGLFLLAVGLYVGGCTSESLQRFVGLNPDKTPLVIDEDGDTVPEAYGYDTTGDGKVDAEIEGTRAEFTAAKNLDKTASDLGATITLLLGGGTIGGTIAGLWGRIMPSAKLLHWMNTAKGLTRSIQKIRKSDVISAESITEVDRILGATEAEISGLAAAVTEIKAAWKAAADKAEAEATPTVK